MDGGFLAQGLLYVPKKNQKVSKEEKGVSVRFGK